LRILLADDHDLVRDALGALLMKDSPSIELVTVCDLPVALEAFRTQGPFDVVILDLRMPGMDGLAGAERMVKLTGTVPVVLMSGSARTADVQAALRIGVRGFVPKTIAGKSLMNAVRLVASGEVYVPMEFVASAVEKGNDIAGLSARERDVLVELRQGRSNKEIAKTLDIAETTVKLHLRSISDKLQARNRTEIVIRAIDAGLA
jgi:DNA-binding NarL/FixJ family response regulator